MEETGHSLYDTHRARLVLEPKRWSQIRSAIRASFTAVCENNVNISTQGRDCWRPISSTTQIASTKCCPTVVLGSRDRRPSAVDCTWMPNDMDLYSPASGYRRVQDWLLQHGFSVVRGREQETGGYYYSEISIVVKFSSGRRNVDMGRKQRWLPCSNSTLRR